MGLCKGHQKCLNIFVISVIVISRIVKYHIAPFGNIMSIPDVKDELKSLAQQEQLLINPLECLFWKWKNYEGVVNKASNAILCTVHADVNKTVRLIQRNMNESKTIPVKKRSLNFKSHIAFEQVWPEKFLKAAKWLKNLSNFFSK